MRADGIDPLLVPSDHGVVLRRLSHDVPFGRDRCSRQDKDGTDHRTQGKSLSYAHQDDRSAGEYETASVNASAKYNWIRSSSQT
jgi:hypothetical protein